jgi:hypothetical protein
VSVTCKSCGAAIVWAQTESGRRMPLDAEPERRFVLAGVEPTIARSVPTYVSHFATCPQADEHRRTQ